MAIPERHSPQTLEVAVVVIAHNEDRFIGEALESIECQTLAPREIVVIDDGSTDRTAEIARSVDGPVPIRVITLDANGGIIPARMRGVAETTTPWVAVCDADDRWEPTKLEQQQRFLSRWSGRRPLVALGTDGVVIAEDGRRRGVVQAALTTEDDLRRWLASPSPLLLPHSSVVFRRSDYDLVGGYDTSEVGLEDTGLWERMTARGNVLVVPSPLVAYRKKMGGGVSREFWFRQVNRERLLMNRRRRQEGQAPLSYDAVEGLLARQRWGRRMVRRAGWWSAYAYERAGFLWLNGRRVRALPLLGLSFVMSPRSWVSRVGGRLGRQHRAARPGVVA